MNLFKIKVNKKRSAISGPEILILKSSYCSITRSGWHLPASGVAVTSQILCISITLNKRKITILNFHIANIIHRKALNVKGFYSILKAFTKSSILADLTTLLTVSVTESAIPLMVSLITFMDSPRLMCYYLMELKERS